MKIFHLIFLSVSALMVRETLESPSAWNYDTVGPDAWPYEFEQCAGNAQSPINIETDSIEYDKNLKSFKFINYDVKYTWNVSHTGHGVLVNRIEGLKQAVGFNGSDFDNQFDLQQLHFHWGYNKYQGSEHLIDGKKYPLELHLVHKYNSRLAILGFVFQLSQNDNEALTSILPGIDIARSKEYSKYVLFSLSSVLPAEEDLDKYYRYSGSLTTPPCTEGVTWTVFSKPINISANQLKNFHFNTLKMNFRETQEINNRQVFSSFSLRKNQVHDEHDDEDDDDDHGKSSAPSKQKYSIEFSITILSASFLAKKFF